MGKSSAELVRDVLPYEEMKLRMLNAVIHSWRIWGILPDISTLMTHGR